MQNHSYKRVAIKRAKSFQYNHIIEHEATVLSQLKHKNILKLLGKHESEPEIVLEIMDLGNLVSAVEVSLDNSKVQIFSRFLVSM